MPLLLLHFVLLKTFPSLLLPPDFFLHLDRNGAFSEVAFETAISSTELVKHTFTIPYVYFVHSILYDDEIE